VRINEEPYIIDDIPNISNDDIQNPADIILN